MESRAALPVGLPSPEPTISYWQTPPASIADHRTTPSPPAFVSTVVVGSGITGTSVAYRLLEAHPNRSIVLLEARTACSGASGRNGGHTKCASYRSFLDNIQALGEAEAVKIVRYEYACMKAVHAFAHEHGISCDSWEGDTVDVIYDQDQWTIANESVSKIKSLLGPDDPAARYTFWDTFQTEQVFLTPGAVGAVTYEAGSINAYRFVISLLTLALAKGLNLQTETPATAITKVDDGWQVTTPRGIIHAAEVVLATNGYTAALCSEFQGSIMPFRGQITAQRPGMKMPSKGLATTYSFIYTKGYEYMVPRPPGSSLEGDLVIGGGLTKGSDNGLYEFGTTNDAVVDQTIIKYLTESTPRYFEMEWGNDHPEGRVRNQWSGIMGYSADGHPFVGDVPGRTGLYVAASFQGHGMVLCFLTAKALVHIMSNKHDEELYQWYPRAFRVTEERIRKPFKNV